MLNPQPAQIVLLGDRMKKENQSPTHGSHAVDDPEVTLAEPEWIGKVLCLAGLVTADSEIGQETGKPLPRREKTHPLQR